MARPGVVGVKPAVLANLHGDGQVVGGRVHAGNRRLEREHQAGAPDDARHAERDQGRERQAVLPQAEQAAAPLEPLGAELVPGPPDGARDEPELEAHEDRERVDLPDDAEDHDLEDGEAS